MNIHTLILALCIPAGIVLAGCCSKPYSAPAAESQNAVPDSPEDVAPMLIGQDLPDLVLTSPDGTPFDLNAAVAEKPAVLIFYRGGWCPYCTTHLGQLQSIEAQLIAIGFQVLAVSPDRPQLLNRSNDNLNLSYTLLSDSDMSAAKALGIAFKLDDATVAAYKDDYGIDIEADSGKNHHLLPVPAVFIVNRNGLITFSYVNPNYKVRIAPDLLLAAAESSLEL